MTSLLAEGLPPGWLTGAEQECLTELARDKDVLEVGTFLGRSTIIMARVARSILTVDPHTGSPEISEALRGTQLGRLVIQPDGSFDSLPGFIEYLHHYGLRDKVGVVVAPFEAVAPFLRTASFGVAFVDGDHSYEHALADGWTARRLVKPWGKVVFHDHEATWPGVMQAAKELGGARQLAGALAELV